MESGTVKMLCPSNDNQYTKCAISVSGTAIFNGGEVLTQVTSPRGEREERYLSRRLQAFGEKQAAASPSTEVPSTGWSCTAPPHRRTGESMSWW